MNPTSPALNTPPAAAATTPIVSPPCCAPSGDAPVAEGDAAQSFGDLLNVEIDAAALLGEKTDATLAADPPASEQTPALIDPATLGLQLNLPAVQAAPQGRELLGLKSKKEAASDALPVVATPTPAVVSGVALPAETKGVPGVKTSPAERTQNFAMQAPVATEKAAAVTAAEPFAAELKAVAGTNDGTQALAALQHSQASTPAAEPALKLAQPIGSDRWNTELGHNVQMLIQGDQTRASLHVTPPDMGPIEITIDLSGDQASINFSVQQGDTRLALENALPRLREMLGEAGINLGQSQINQQSAEQRQAQGNPGGQSNRFGEAAGGDTPVLTQTIRVGLVDTFA